MHTLKLSSSACRKHFFKTACWILLLVWQSSSWAGSGFYYAIETIDHSLETQTEIELIYTPAPPTPATQVEQRSESFSNTGIYLGYLHKRRRTQSFSLAPEFYIANFDSDELIYGTSFKLAYRWGHVAPFINMGVSRIKHFKQNKVHTGIGALFTLSDHVSLKLEWLRYDTIEETSSSSKPFAGQTLTTNIDTERDIEAIKLGLVFYFHE